MEQYRALKKDQCIVIIQLEQIYDTHLVCFVKLLSLYVDRKIKKKNWF